MHLHAVLAPKLAVFSVLQRHHCASGGNFQFPLANSAANSSSQASRAEAATRNVPSTSD
jgi:hypothetical protein